jgi:isoleucyl-tRNA synthetase
MVLDFKAIEQKARKVWKKYDKEIASAIQDNPKKKLFSFLEGPPTANAPPGLHHLEVRTFKDLICKYQFMKGNSVPRKGGWDCHGLPVEVQVEKALGLNSKKDIEKYGTGKFIKKARMSVFSNIKDWEASTRELNYWIDLENPYATLDNNYVESVWWSLKELYKKKMLYEGYKVVPFCPRCETPLSSHEVSQGYKDIKEDSVYIAFKVKGKPGEYILAWTTTPWTLPGNVALAVNKKIDYVKVKLEDGDFAYLAKERLGVIRGDYKIVEEMKGSKLVGMEYEPLYDIKELQNENSHKIIPADFVTTESGTGIVHTAGMYGEDDYVVCQELGLPLVHTVNQSGEFNSLVPKWEGKFVKSVEYEIMGDLRDRGLLYRKDKNQHTYPFCWRCDSPLLYYAIDSWFIKVSSVRDKLVKKNKEINWYPEHIKDGRFGKWLEGAKDWSLSRFKYWGTPLPIWRCSDCKKDKIIGSVEELKKESIKSFKDYDLHRPWIDKIKIKCDCGKEMSRIPDVIDCWYDSGSASFAQFHYPFENKKEFERRYPYDYIAEAIDQTRGWFYTLHVLGVLLFDKPAYKNVISAGHIVDDKGEKMSKTKGNVIVPKDIIDKTGVDAVRLQFCTTDVGNFKRFSHELMRKSVLPFLSVLDNTYRYYLQLGEKKNNTAGTEVKSSVGHVEDKWVLSRLNTVIGNVTSHLDKYKLDLALAQIMNFVVNDFSRSYIKFTRDRDDTKEVLGEVLEKVSLLLAPYAPYISEYIYSEFSKDSVHLSSWPKVDKKKVDDKLELQFCYLLEIIEKGLAERDREKIGLKWPLSKAVVSGAKIGDDLVEIVKTQLNVKSVSLKNGKEISVKLDTRMTPELEAEGYAREVSRKIQAMRKTAGLVKEDRIKLSVVSSELQGMLEGHKTFIMERVGAAELVFEDGKYKHIEESKIKGKVINIMFSKV